MDCKRATMSVLLAAGLVAATLMPARADPAYVAFPPFWPLITLGWIAESVVAVATAPFRPYYCPPCYGAPPPYYAPSGAAYYPPPGYSAPGYNQPGYYPAR